MCIQGRLYFVSPDKAVFPPDGASSSYYITIMRTRAASITLMEQLLQQVVSVARVRKRRLVSHFRQVTSS